jgi:hypothetical protein
MGVRVSIGLIMALGIITLGGAQACARGLAKGSKVAYNSNAAIIATSQARSRAGLEPFYYQATWRNSRF